MSYVCSEKSLNDDQRRAILKVCNEADISWIDFPNLFYKLL